jgi:hypothetical protein
MPTTDIIPCFARTIQNKTGLHIKNGTLLSQVCADDQGALWFTTQLQTVAVMRPREQQFADAFALCPEVLGQFPRSLLVLMMSYMEPPEGTHYQLA